VRADAPETQIKAAARKIQLKLNPHPAGQMELNVPRLEGRPIQGMQHKYRETVLFFPSQGQTCHAYCTYCFRWAQFVGIDELKFANREAEAPLVMKTAVLRRYVEPLLASELEHLVSIRIGTKALGYWPYRFLTDSDADDLLRLFESVRRAGRHLAVMAHFSHPRELETPAVGKALRRVLSTGAVVRCQAPLVRYVNDSATTWAEMWRSQVRQGAVPYYMFVERDTGPKNYFEVPLARALEIFGRAYRRVSGLARTVRGPSMSAGPGKVLVDGEATIHGERVLVLKFLQARNPRWVNRPFFARWDPAATWLRDLRPAFGEREFFFTREMEQIRKSGRAPAWGVPPGATARRSAASFGHVEWE
jgi:L-lysine 2,3-aminomutase